MPHLLFFRLPLGAILAAGVLSAHASEASDSPDEAYRLAYTLFNSNRLDEAAALFARAAATTNAERQAAAWMGRGEALYRSGRWSEAAAAYDALLARCPSSPHVAHALYARGFAEFKAGRLSEAQGTLSRFLWHYPAHALAASAVAATGTLARAQAAQAARDEGEKLRRTLTEIEALSRDDARAPQAVAAARMFLLANPSHPQTGNLRYLAATCALKTRDPALIVDACRDCLTNHADHAQAQRLQFELAQSLEALGRYDEAAKAFAVVDGTEAAVRRAENLHRAGRTGEAYALAAALQGSLAQADPPRAARAALVAGDCLAEQQNWKEAERAFWDIGARPGAEAFKPTALDRLAGLYEKMGLKEKAAFIREDLRLRYPAFGNNKQPAAPQP